MFPRRLPVELERMIFLLLPDRTAHRCLTVARWVRVWLEPNVYRVVCLTTEKCARKFLESMRCRPEFALSMIEALCLNVSVRLDTAATILTLCSGIRCLNMRMPCHLFGENPVWDPLAKLSRLAVLYVDLSSLFNKSDIYLPSLPVFHSVTHLHLSNAWAGWSPTANSIGLEHLTQITHLSLYLSTVRTLPTLLRRVLDRRDLCVLVLWKRSRVLDSTVMQFLEDSNLQDNRVVVLDERMFQYHMLDKGFWGWAERAVKQRQETGATFSPCDGNIVAPYVIQYADSHSETGSMVQTDVESNDSSDESGDESEDL